MHDFLDDKYVDMESIMSYQNSDILISLFFALIDIIIIIFSSLNLKSNSYHITMLRHKIIKLFIIDIISRLLYTKKYNKWNLFRELISSFLNTSQFFLIFSFINEVLLISKSSTSKKMELKRETILFCLIFLIITFPYENIPFISFKLRFINFKVNKIIILVQSYCILLCIYKIYNNIKEKIVQIGNNMINETGKKKKIYLIIIGSPISCLILFSFHYALKIIFVFIKNPIFLIYANILLNILKETSIYFIFLLCQLILYILNKIKTDKEKKSQIEFKRYIEEIDDIMKT